MLLILILGRSIHTLYKVKTEALVVVNKGVGLEVIADKLSAWSCLEIRMQDKIKTERHNKSLGGV